MKYTSNCLENWYKRFTQIQTFLKCPKVSEFCRCQHFSTVMTNFPKRSSKFSALIWQKRCFWRHIMINIMLFKSYKVIMFIPTAHIHNKAWFFRNLFWFFSNIIWKKCDIVKNLRSIWYFKNLLDSCMPITY